MKTKYRIKEEQNEFGHFYFIQRKTLLGFWINQFGRYFPSLDSAKKYFDARQNREVVIHNLETK